MRALSSRYPLLLLAVLTAAAVLVHGYHLGVEDQAVYLPAIKKHLDPSLYPYDADFFLLQTRLALFVEVVGWTARATRLPLEWVVFLWHFASIYLLLLGCWLLARRCFPRPRAQWAGVVLVAALLTLPVAGTRLLLVDQYLHPRTLATAGLLFAMLAALESSAYALLWLILAGLMHPTMTLFGAIHVILQASWPILPGRLLERTGATPQPVPAGNWIVPLGLALPIIQESHSDAWREALAGRNYLFPQRWKWYELLGAFAPLLILAWFSRLARHRGQSLLERLSLGLAISGAVGIAAGIVIGLAPSLIALVPLEPMRALHLVYLFLLLLGGGLLGEFLLKDRAWRWLALFGVLSAGMFLAQRAEFPSSPHIEWPGRPTRNAWVEAFDWIRRTTPRDALFALDPGFLEREGEDEHGFRSFAERSQLAEGGKDRAVSRNLPGLAYAWRQQVHDQIGLDNFPLEKFQALRRKYGATWVVLGRLAPGAASLDCPFANAAVRVCRIP